MASMTPCICSSGVDAPAVTPTLCAPLEPLGIELVGGLDVVDARR